MSQFTDSAGLMQRTGSARTQLIMHDPATNWHRVQIQTDETAIALLMHGAGHADMSSDKRY